MRQNRIFQSGNKKRIVKKSRWDMHSWGNIGLKTGWNYASFYILEIWRSQKNCFPVWIGHFNELITGFVAFYIFLVFTPLSLSFIFLNLSLLLLLLYLLFFWITPTSAHCILLVLCSAIISEWAQRKMCHLGDCLINCVQVKYITT